MITSFLTGLVLGVIAGLLIMRKHHARASELEAKGRQALDALKGK